jgi:hypothetical protein
MKISALIKLLQKIQEKRGDLEVEGCAPHYEPEFPIKAKNVYILEVGTLHNDFSERTQPVVVIGPD